MLNSKGITAFIDGANKIKIMNKILNELITFILDLGIYVAVLAVCCLIMAAALHIAKYKRERSIMAIMTVIFFFISLLIFKNVERTQNKISSLQKKELIKTEIPLKT